MPPGVMTLNPEVGPNLYELLTPSLPHLLCTLKGGHGFGALRAQAWFAHPSTMFFLFKKLY